MSEDRPHVRLLARKDAIEAEIEAIAGELNSGERPPGLKGSLLDAEGFPRADLDLYRVRQLRQRHAQLQTDHLHTMKEIEDYLFSGKAFQLETAGPAAASTAAEAPVAAKRARFDRDKPLAVVNEVFVGSPADEAGLQRGDILVGFGPVVAAEGQDHMRAIADAVSASVGRAIDVHVFRGGDDPELVSLRLVPHPWGGRGLLGCHIVAQTAAA